MSKIFRFDCYPHDWLLDTSRLTPEDRGIYVQIVMLKSMRAAVTRSPVPASSNASVRSLTPSLLEQELDLLEFEDIWDALPLRALPHEFDRVAINPLVSHRVSKERAHQIPDLRFGSLRPLDVVEPLFDRDSLHLVELVIPIG